MEHFSTLAIVLKTFRYAERDLIVNLLTEDHGRISALAKGAVHSKRYGGSLGFLTVSQVRCAHKETAELHRLEEAVVRHEFRNIPKDMEAMAVASCMVEVCLKLLEERSPVREVFVALSNALFYLDAGKQKLLVLEAFLMKVLMVLGYAPRLASCVVCEKKISEMFAADTVVTDEAMVYWSAQWGGVVCRDCGDKAFLKPLNPELIKLFAHILAVPFKDLTEQSPQLLDESFEWLTHFMQHHIPAIQSGGGLKSFHFFNNLTVL